MPFHTKGACPFALECSMKGKCTLVGHAFVIKALKGLVKKIHRCPFALGTRPESLAQTFLILQKRSLLSI